jgi:hypothetical protein
MGKVTGFAEELSALGTVLETLEPLDEAKRLFVLRTAIERLGISGAGLGAQRATGLRDAAGGASDTGSPVAPTEVAGMTPKEFMRNKQPTTDVQRIACLAYYLTHGRGTAQFKTADLTRLNTEAACAPFSNATVAVMNATATSGFLAPAGGGRKQIAALGEDVVNALPNQEQAKAVVTAGKKGRRRRTRKNPAKR